MKEEDGPKLYDDFVSYVKRVLSGYAPDRIRDLRDVVGAGRKRRFGGGGGGIRRRILPICVARVREDIGDETLPFMLFQVGSDRVVEGMRHVAGTVENVTLIPQNPDPSSGDYYDTMENGHYNHVGMKKLGSRFAEVFLTDVRTTVEVEIAGARVSCVM